MTNPRIQVPQQNGVNEFIAEAFQMATIALVCVLGLLTVAVSI